MFKSVPVPVLPAEKKRMAVSMRLAMFWTFLTEKAPTLMWWDIGAGILQIVSAIALSIAYGVISADDDTAKRPGLLYVDTLQPNFTVLNLEWARVELFWVLIWMPIITAVFHFWQAILLANVSDSRLIPVQALQVHPRDLSWLSFFDADAYLVSIGNGINAVRWVEYSISAALMTVILYLSSGVTNIFLIFLGGVVCNVAMQLCGLEHERVRAQMYDRIRANKPAPLPFYKRWSLPFTIGSIIFFGQWSIVFCYFFRTVNASEEINPVPTTVRIIVIGLFFGFTSFAINSIVFPCKWLKFDTFEKQEIAQKVLSALNKTLLDWTFFVAIVSSV